MTASQVVTRFAVYPGVYKDSLVLMQLQLRLLERTGIIEAGAAMASPANLELLEAGGLLPDALPALQGEDLLVVVRAGAAAEAEAALGDVSALLEARHTAEADAYRPRSLDGALSLLPDARWALVSVPGSYASRVAREALDRRLNVFLYSDNVGAEEALELKREATRRGLLVLGPDCGTAIIAGVGLGFANRVRRGAIGLVGGSGTGLQAVSVAIHSLGGGISQAIGTGGQDLSEEVGGITTRQALRLLADDEDTRVIVLISKAPGEGAARRALGWAADCGKPVVVYLQGFDPAAAAWTDSNVHLATGLAEAAATASALLGTEAPAGVPDTLEGPPAPVNGLLRGLFAGGTLAAEALYVLSDRLQPLYSNIAGKHWRRLDDLFTSRGHTVLDLGADELTRGRLHPMIDQAERLKRLALEAADPEVGLILLDIVLGEGTHPDPAEELAPAIREVLESAANTGRELRVVVILVGTEEDPQDLESQRERLEAVGAVVTCSVETAALHAAASQVEDEPPVPMLRRDGAVVTEPRAPDVNDPEAPKRAVDASAVSPPLTAINIGLESFHASLLAQGAQAVQVDWRPPAGGDQRLLSILDRIRSSGSQPQEGTQA